MARFSSAFSFKNGLTLKNRTVLAPMTNSQSFADGTLSADELRWLARRAEGGFSLLVTAASHVQPDGQAWAGQLGCFDDRHVAGLAELANLGRTHGCATVLQLFHGGVRSPRALTGVTPTAPSALTLDFPGFETPRALEDREIETTISNFVVAGVRAHRAGLSGVEIHGANGYLLTQFLSRVTNQRTDRWGGALENRARPLTEIVRRLRAAVPADFLIGVRLLAEDAPAQRGFDIDETARVARWLSDLGVDYVHLSAGDVRATSWSHPTDPLTNVARLRRALPLEVALIASGGVTRGAQADAALEDGADLVALGKVAISTPDWPCRAGDVGFAPAPFPLTPAQAAAVDVAPAFIDVLTHFGLVKADARAG